MKKSTTILLLAAALSFGYLPTCTMSVEASNPTAVTDKDPKDHKTKKPHTRSPNRLIKSITGNPSRLTKFTVTVHPEDRCRP